MGYYEEISDIRKERAYPLIRTVSERIKLEVNSNGGKKPSETLPLEERFKFQWHEIAIELFPDLLPSETIESIKEVPVIVSNTLAHVKKSTAEAILEAFDKKLLPHAFFAEYISHIFNDLVSIVSKDGG